MNEAFDSLPRSLYSMSVFDRLIGGFGVDFEPEILRLIERLRELEDRVIALEVLRVPDLDVIGFDSDHDPEQDFDEDGPEYVIDYNVT